MSTPEAQKAARWIAQHSFYVLGYLDSLEGGLNELRVEKGLPLVEHFVDRRIFKEG